MSELSEKIASAIHDETTLDTHIVRSRRLRMADRILAIPEIAGALNQVYGEGELARHIGNFSGVLNPPSR